MKDLKVTGDRINLLHPKIRKEVKDLIDLAESKIDSNLSIRVVQSLRTIDEQNDLYNQGRTTPGSIVTNSKGGQSYHNYGLAIDFCFLFDGKYDDKKSWLVGPNHHIVVKIFTDAGYTWGGGFSSIKDYPHFENNFGYNWRKLLDKYNSNDLFIDNGIKYVNL